MTKLNQLVTCGFLFCFYQAEASPAGVYFSIDNVNVESRLPEEKLLIFYGDGYFGPANAWNKWIPEHRVKYCDKASGFRCMIGPMIFAYPMNKVADTWCFAGFSYSKKQIDKYNNQRFFITAIQRYKHDKKIIEKTTSFVYDELLGVDFIEYNNQRYSLISRTGILGDEFIAGMSEVLTDKEFGVLANLCEHTGASDALIQNIILLTPDSESTFSASNNVKKDIWKTRRD